MTTSENGANGFIPKGYEVIVSFTLATPSKLIENNLGRFVKTVQLFNKDEIANPTPRLPYNTEQEFVDLNTKILARAQELFTECILNKNKTTCGNVPISRLIIFDNNMPLPITRLGTKNKTYTYMVVYDSLKNPNMNASDFKDILNKSLFEGINTNTRKRKFSRTSGGKTKTAKRAKRSYAKTFRRPLYK